MFTTIAQVKSGSDILTLKQSQPDLITVEYYDVSMEAGGVPWRVPGPIDGDFVERVFAEGVKKNWYFRAMVASFEKSANALKEALKDALATSKT